MIPRIAAVVEACGPVWALLRTIASLERQTRPAQEVLVIAHSEEERRATAMLVASGRARAVEVEGRSAGGACNAAVEQSRADLLIWLRAGDVLEPDYLDAAIPPLDGGRECDWVAAGVMRAAVPGARGPLSFPDSDLAAMVVGPSRVPVGAVLRRSLWAELGGFDASLDDLHEWDFWLGVAERRCPGLVLDRALVTRPLAAVPLEERAGALARRAHTYASILSKRRAFLGRDPTTLLVGQEREIERLAARHGYRRRRRDAAVAEIAALEGEHARLAGVVGQTAGGRFAWGDFARTIPVSAEWGFDRGTPVDRHYIEGFIERWGDDVRGVVLEVQEPELARRFGGARVERADVIDIDPANPRATIVADLRRASAIADGVYDCVILTQTLHLIDDMRAVVGECHRILKPGGVLLATLPCLSRVAIEYGPDGDYSRVTAAGARELFATTFSRQSLTVQAFGNLMTSVAFLHGLALEELPAGTLERAGPHFPLIVGVRAVKAGGGPRRTTPRGGRGNAGAILLYHRVAAPASDVHGLAIDPSEFDEQMAVLSREFEPLPLADLAAAAAADRLPERAVAVTFDDGYLDNLSVAAPILQGYGVPATFFISTVGLEPGAEYWWDTLEGVLLCGRPVPSHLTLEIAGLARRFPTSTPSERLEAHQALHGLLVGAEAEARNAVMDRILDWARTRRPVRADACLLDREGARALAARPGNTLGAHGEHHLALPALGSVSRDREVRASLQGLSPQPVTAFSYPYGAIDEASVEAVRRAGYSFAVSCEAGVVRAGVNPLMLPRIEVKRASGPALALTLAELFAAATGARS